jgi:hypothetical protein
VILVGLLSGADTPLKVNVQIQKDLGTYASAKREAGRTFDLGDRENKAPGYEWIEFSVPHSRMSEPKLDCSWEAPRTHGCQFIGWANETSKGPIVIDGGSTVCIRIHWNSRECGVHLSA